MRRTKLLPFACAAALFSCGGASDRNPPPGTSAVLAGSAPEDEPASILPELWLARLVPALRPGGPEWGDALTQQAEQGDAVVLFALTHLRTELADDASAERLDAALRRLAERTSAATPSDVAGGLRAQLERAAWADLMCHELEHGMKGWTFEAVRPWLAEPEVREELERLRDDYTAELEVQTLFSSMDERVPTYARQLLEEAATGGKR